MSSPNFQITGEDNIVQIADTARVQATIEIVGNRNTIEIGEFATLNGTFLSIRGDGSRLSIGSGTAIGSSGVHVWEGRSITIGSDSTISVECWISTSDMHPIFDARGRRLNPAADIVIGDHVWIGLRCVILKGVRIGNGAIVAATSTVSGSFKPNTLIAGIPARPIRRNVRWDWAF